MNQVHWKEEVYFLQLFQIESELRNSVEILSTPVPSHVDISSPARVNTFYGLLEYIKNRIPIHIPGSTCHICAHSQETDPWM